MLEGLLALMLLHHARRDARLGANGEVLSLEDQDRSLWRRGETGEGIAILERALRHGRPGPYQLHAARLAYRTAIRLSQSDAERLFLAKKMEALA